MNTKLSFADWMYNHTKGQVSSRPDYYSGRGINSGDLGPEHLNLIGKGVKADFGAEAFEKFLDLVALIPDISATSFLIHFREFYCRDCTSVPCFEKNAGNTIEGRGEAAYVVGMASIFSAFSADNSPYSAFMLKREYFRSIKRKDMVVKIPRGKSCDKIGHKYGEPNDR